jgi:Tfp pilus assembly major pilin PilA
MDKKFGWISFLMLVAVCTGIALSVKPWQKYQEQKAQAVTARKEMRQMEAQHAKLLREKSQLESPIGREELARERGYKKPEEKPWEPK